MPLHLPRNHPPSDEIEISIFGPGFGECLLAHVGAGRWVIIDSCINRLVQKPAALEYFDAIGADPAASVDLILATHWHDDHVAGIDLVVEACPKAVFWCSDALQTPEFLALLELKLSRKDIKFTRGTAAMSRVVDILGQSKSINFALAAMRIYQQNLIIDKKDVPVEMWTLSPSQAENMIAKQNIGALIESTTAPQARIPARNPNHSAVAAALMIGADHLLLGADLEEPGDPELGWSAVVANMNRPQNLKASVFKIPHHGSATAHHDETWTHLIEPKPVSAATPWYVGNNVLPKQSDIDRICSMSARAYISRSQVLTRSKRRQNVVQKLVPPSLRRLPEVPGQIRLRKQIFGPSPNWDVALFDGADELKNFQATRT
jgi:hypothetical protein